MGSTQMTFGGQQLADRRQIFRRRPSTANVQVRFHEAWNVQKNKIETPAFFIKLAGFERLLEKGGAAEITKTSKQKKIELL